MTGFLGGSDFVFTGQTTTAHVSLMLRIIENGHDGHRR